MKINIKSFKAFALVLTLLSVIAISSPLTAHAATKSGSYIVNVYDGGNNYSGRYERDVNFGTINGGALGKTITIQNVNAYSVLSKTEKAYFHQYARYGVYVYRNNKLYKYYGNLRDGSTFKIPSGNSEVVIHTSIDSSGWSKFGANNDHYTYAQFRISY